MVEIAGPDLIQKTYKKKISEGWEVVVDKNGKLKLLYNKSEVKIGGFVSKTRVDMKRGFVRGVLFCCGVFGALAWFFLIFWLYN
jgi:hypothetical protein